MVTCSRLLLRVALLIVVSHFSFRSTAIPSSAMDVSVFARDTDSLSRDAAENKFLNSAINFGNVFTKLNSRSPDWVISSQISFYLNRADSIYLHFLENKNPMAL